MAQEILDLTKRGYAPGNYSYGKCDDCKERLDNVEKRAWRCEKCAMKARDEEIKENSIPREEMIKFIYEKIPGPSIQVTANICKKGSIMIGDVLHWMDEAGIEFLGGQFDKGRTLLTIWETLNKPVQDQPHKLLLFIYKILKDDIK